MLCPDVYPGQVWGRLRCLRDASDEDLPPFRDKITPGGGAKVSRAFETVARKPGHCIMPPSPCARPWSSRPGLAPASLAAGPAPRRSTMRCRIAPYLNRSTQQGKRLSAEISAPLAIHTVYHFQCCVELFRRIVLHSVPDSPLCRLRGFPSGRRVRGWAQPVGPWTLDDRPPHAPDDCRCRDSSLV